MTIHHRAPAMKVFHCPNCQNLLYFENVLCERCRSEIGFLPSAGRLVTLSPPQADAPAKTTPVVARKCQNYVDHAICNWAVNDDDPNPLCLSCRLTTVIPNLEIEGSLQAWRKLENAKRRLLYSLMELRLPLITKAEDPAAGLQFQFMADQTGPSGDHARVLTGHDDGTITINVGEADDAERERRRVNLNEPYRTLLGHMRHEIGHYFWDRLIRDSDRLEAFRALFGDESVDYAQALKTHYDAGPPADWQQSFVSTYASSHPWEDWAETWAHYLHIGDTLETADDCGLSLRPRRSDEPSLALAKTPESPVARDFDVMMERWLAVTHLLNMLNRGLGFADAYPFVLSAPAIEKMRFVHEVLEEYVARAKAGTVPTTGNPPPGNSNPLPTSGSPASAPSNPPPATAAA